MSRHMAALMGAGLVVDRRDAQWVRYRRAPRLPREVVALVDAALAWRFLLFQKDSALAQWYRSRTESGGKKRKTMIVALARKLLIALWRLVTTGEVPAGVVLRAA